MDDNKDGKISKDELNNILNLKLPKEKCQDLEVMMQQMDANEDGFIDYHEFINVALINNEFLKKENLV